MFMQVQKFKYSAESSEIIQVRYFIVGNQTLASMMYLSGINILHEGTINSGARMPVFRDLYIHSKHFSSITWILMTSPLAWTDSNFVPDFKREIESHGSKLEVTYLVTIAL